MEIKITNHTEKAYPMITGLVSYQISATKAANEQNPKMAAVFDHGLNRCITNRSANAPRESAATFHEDVRISASLTKYVAQICEAQ